MSESNTLSRRLVGAKVGSLFTAILGSTVFGRTAAAAEAPAAAVMTTVGIAVADLEKSTRFYTEAFGFKAQKAQPNHVTAKAGDTAANLTELENGFDLSTQFIDAGGITIELIAFANPKPVGDGARAPLNRRGINHLTIRVADAKATFEKVRQLGGLVLDSKPTGGATFVIDPDGTRLEIAQQR